MADDLQSGGMVAGLLINEIMTDNESTFQVEGLQSPDWVELYNAGADPVDLAEVNLVDGDGITWKGPSEILDPGAHLLLLADGQDLPGHLPFALSASGDSLDLYEGGLIVDAVQIPDLPGDVALARVPDAGEWKASIRPTPGWLNGTAGTDSMDPRDTVFQDDHVIHVQVVLSDEDRASLGRRSSEQVEVGVSIEGIWYPSVGMSLKGSGSYQPITGKCAFKLDLNDFANPDARFRGLTHLTFNNGVTYDPTWTHEWLTYSVFREAGIAAPRVGWARVFINDEDYGLYMNVETYDTTFLERNYFNPDGELWEGSGSDFGWGGERNFHYESGPEPPDLTILSDVSDLINEQPTNENLVALGRLVDLEEFARYMALEALTMQWDGYWSPNNWRIYHNPDTDLIEWLPTGVDYTWVSWWSDLWSGNGQVYRWCLQNESWRRRYDEQVIEMSDLILSMDLPVQFDVLSEWLDPEIQTDTRTPHSMNTIRSERTNTRSNLETWPRQAADQAERDINGL